MRRLLLIIGLTVLCLNGYGQELAPITVFEGERKFNETISFKYGFAKGDLVILTYKSHKDRAIKEVKITSGDGIKQIYASTESPSTGSYQYKMLEDDVLVFTFEGRDVWNRTFQIKIQRIPASEATIHFNTGVTTRNKTQDMPFKYLHFEQTDVKEEIIEHKVNMFEKYIMQEDVIWEDDFQLKGLLGLDLKNSTKQQHIELPEPPTPEAKFYRMSYYLNSAIGGSQHWSVAKTAVPLTASIASSFLLTPAGGAAVGGATTMAMDAMGPQDNGEPTTVIFSPGKEMDRVNSISDKDARMNYLNLATTESFGASMTSLYTIKPIRNKHEYLLLMNLDGAKAKNVKTNVTATYYAPLYKPAIVKEKIFTPIVESEERVDTFKYSTEKEVPIGLTANANGDMYELVEYPDTTWTVKMIDQSASEKVSLVPRMKRIKSQVTTKSEMVYNQSFAAVPGNNFAAKIHLPDPINDGYQTMKYKKLKFTLTVNDATYEALKNQISNVAEAGLSYGIGKGTGKLTSKMGSSKPPGDESMNMVEKIVDAQEKYETTTEVIETSKDVKDVYNDDYEEEEEQEAFFIENGGKANTVLNKVGVNADVTEYIPDAMLKLKIPSVADISDKAADAITPKIKDKVTLKVSASKNPGNFLINKHAGFLVDSLDLTDDLNFSFLIENPRQATDLRNLLSLYLYGNLMVEVEYELINYKDMIVYEEIREPVAAGAMPEQEYKVVTRRKYVPKNEVEPWHKIVSN